jgi:hypothetical protein
LRVQLASPPTPSHPALLQQHHPPLLSAGPPASSNTALSLLRSSAAMPTPVSASTTPALLRRTRHTGAGMRASAQQPALLLLLAQRARLLLRPLRLRMAAARPLPLLHLRLPQLAIQVEALLLPPPQVHQHHIAAQQPVLHQRTRHQPANLRQSRVRHSIHPKPTSTHRRPQLHQPTVARLLIPICAA